MHIRRTRPYEIDMVMAIYAQAREYMAEHGNPSQWGPTCWPPRKLIEDDIAQGKSYVCETDTKRIAAVFFFDYGKDIEPTYAVIEDGSWASDTPYAVVHRIASAEILRGAGTACLNWAFAQSRHVRIDTHPDNSEMCNLLTKLGFERRGIIHVTEDSFPRVAFERIA